MTTKADITRLEMATKADIARLEKDLLIFRGQVRLYFVALAALILITKLTLDLDQILTRF